MAMAVQSAAATIFTTRASTRMRMRAGDDQAGARSQRRRRRRGDSATRPRCRAARRGVPRHGRSGRCPASAARLGSAARRGLAPRGAAAQCPASAARLGVAVAARRGDSTAPRGTAARRLGAARRPGGAARRFGGSAPTRFNLRFQILGSYPRLQQRCRQLLCGLLMFDLKIRRQLGRCLFCAAPLLRQRFCKARCTNAPMYPRYKAQIADRAAEAQTKTLIEV